MCALFCDFKAFKCFRPQKRYIFFACGANISNKINDEISNKLSNKISNQQQTQQQNQEQAQQQKQQPKQRQNLIEFGLPAQIYGVVFSILMVFGHKTKNNNDGVPCVHFFCHFNVFKCFRPQKRSNFFRLRRQHQQQNQQRNQQQIQQQNQQQNQQQAQQQKQQPKQRQNLIEFGLPAQIELFWPLDTGEKRAQGTGVRRGQPDKRVKHWVHV